MGDNERFEFIKSKWEDADFHEGKYEASHDETRFLIEMIEKLSNTKERK